MTTIYEILRREVGFIPTTRFVAKKLLAAGVVVRFIIQFPETLFECVCRDCGPSESPDYRGALTGQGPLVF